MTTQELKAATTNQLSRTKLYFEYQEDDAFHDAWKKRIEFTRELKKLRSHFRTLYAAVIASKKVK